MAFIKERPLRKDCWRYLWSRTLVPSSWYAFQVLYSSISLIYLVSLPELVAQTNMDQQSVNRLREELTKLTNWISRNAVTYFVSEYEVPGAQYIEKARSQ